MMTNKSPVLIAELFSPSAPESKNNLPPGDILIRQNAVRPAVQKESRTRLETAVIAAVVPEPGITRQARGRCSQPNALRVAKTQKCLSNPGQEGQSTVQTATTKRIQQENINIMIGWPSVRRKSYCELAGHFNHRFRLPYP